MKILNLEGLRYLVNNIKNLINTSAENTLTSSKKYTDEEINKVDENVKLIKNQILDPDNYKTPLENGGVVVVNFEQGYISSSTGEEGESEGFLITSFIPVENDKFTLYSDAPVDSTIRIFVYDADKNWINTANGDAGYYRISNGEKADITNEAKYIRCRIGSAATSGTLTVTFDSSNAIHKKVYFNNGYNIESTLIEDNLYQLQVNAEENEFNIFTIAAPKNNASEATLALMLNDEEKTQFVDLSCMKYHEDEDGYFCTILQSRGDTPLPRYILGFNDGKGAGRVRKLEITPDAVPMQFVSNGIRVRKDNAYDNNWTDDNSVVVNLAELATAEENANAYTDTKLASKSDTSHTHNYAGSSSVGGAAINSYKLDGYYADDFVFLQNFMAGNLGSKTAYYSTSVNKDCNSIEDFAALAGGADGLHYPTANTYYYILTLKYADTAKKQIAFGYKGNVVDNIVFRTCNDGTWTAWKGIDADTLDGYHSYDFCQTAFAQETDMNKITVSGAYRVNQGNTNAPSGADWGQLFVVHGGGDTIAQFMFDYQKGRCWLRTGNPSDVNGAGAWTEWRSLYTSENITYGTDALTPGSSSLATGSIYYQYE